MERLRGSYYDLEGFKSYSEYQQWLDTEFLNTWNICKRLRKKLQKSGKLEYDDRGESWDFRTSHDQHYYDASFSDSQTTIRVSYQDERESFTVDKPGFNQRFHYVDYFQDNTFSFSPGGFGGGFVPSEVMRISVGYSGFPGINSNPKSVKFAVERAQEICREFSNLIPNPPSFRERVSRAFLNIARP